MQSMGNSVFDSPPVAVSILESAVVILGFIPVFPPHLVELLLVSVTCVAGSLSASETDASALFAFISALIAKSSLGLAVSWPKIASRSWSAVILIDFDGGDAERMSPDIDSAGVANVDLYFVVRT